MQRLQGIVLFLVSNFGPLVAFYGAYYLWNLKVAVIATIVWTLGELLVCYLRNKKPSAFFLLSATITLVFATIDLQLGDSMLFRYEGACTNAIVGLYFAASLFGKKPLIQEFAEAQGHGNAMGDPDRCYYFRFLTKVWVGYLLLKAALFAWLSWRYSLTQALLLRALIGNVSFYSLLGISLFGYKPLHAILYKLQWLPSQNPHQ